MKKAATTFRGLLLSVISEALSFRSYDTISTIVEALRLTTSEDPVPTLCKIYSDLVRSELQSHMNDLTIYESLCSNPEIDEQSIQSVRSEQILHSSCAKLSNGLYSVCNELQELSLCSLTEACIPNRFWIFFCWMAPRVLSLSTFAKTAAYTDTKFFYSNWDENIVTTRKHFLWCDFYPTLENTLRNQSAKMPRKHHDYLTVKVNVYGFKKFRLLFLRFLNCMNLPGITLTSAPGRSNKLPNGQEKFPVLKCLDQT